MPTKRKRKVIKKGINKNGDVCFVIMPYGDWFDEYFNEIYYQAIWNAGMTPRRADDLYRPSNIVQDIWAYTKQAKIILADLSGKNPNVLYELGLAHALAKPAILVSQTIEDIPFDLRNLRIIIYDKNDSNWGKILMKKITNAIKETIASPKETIPTAFLETSSVNKTRVTPREKEILELREDLELLKKEMRTNYGRDYKYVNSVNEVLSQKREPNASFMKPLLPSKELAEIVGNKPMPRTEIVKKLWEYIKTNGLQDAREKRNINADSALQKVFNGKKQVSMFEMTKLVNYHLFPS
jgi:chromatin remodeling complex protein RSC6